MESKNKGSELLDAARDIVFAALIKDRDGELQRAVERMSQAISDGGYMVDTPERKPHSENAMTDTRDSFENRNSMGQLIRQRRKERRLSMQKLADLCGTSKSYIYEIETGVTVNIGILLAAKICMELPISLTRLAGLGLSDAGEISNG